MKAEHRNDEAEAAYQKALEFDRHLVAEHPSVPQHRIDLASTCVNLGNLRDHRSQSASAISAFDEAIKLFPDGAPARFDNERRSLLDKAYVGRSVAREQQGNPKAQVADLEKAITFASPSRSRVLRLKSATVLSSMGESDCAVTVADTLKDDPGLASPKVFELAAVYVRAAEAANRSTPTADRSAAVNRHIAQGMTLLQHAYSAGYFVDAVNRDKLNRAPFMPLLKTNDAFAKLRDAIQKNPRATRK